MAVIVGILLAAGRGSRFGSDKLLHRLSGGTPMAVAAALNLLSACDRVIAVLRPGTGELHQLIEAAGCTVVICSQAGSGMGHSLAAGVIASHDAAGWIVALADMPFIATSTHQAVAARLRAGASIAACTFAGRRGHPVGFSSRWFEQLSTLTGDHGGKTILETHRQETVFIPVDDPGVVRDIDRPEDLMVNRPVNV